jgi:hypothetical protein
MFSIHPHLVRRLTRVSAVAAALLGLSGCQGIVASPSLSQVRIINATPDAPGLDIYGNNNAVAYNLSLGTVTSYVPLSPGIYTIASNTAGTRQILTTSKATLAVSNQYTVLLGNIAASMQQTVLTDQAHAAPSGQISLRFINQSTRNGPVDIYLVPAGQALIPRVTAAAPPPSAILPIVTNFAFGANAGYLNVSSGAYSIVALPAGTLPTSDTVAPYSGPQVTYAVGAVRTIVLIDQQVITTPGVQVITAADYDPPAS